MHRLRTICAFLLALPLIGSGANSLFGFVAAPSGTGHVGEQVLASMRSGGLLEWLAVGHFALGVLLLNPGLRFAAGVLQLPITFGIVAFNLTLFPPGVPLALAMLALNLGVVSDRARWQRLLRNERSVTSGCTSPTR